MTDYDVVVKTTGANWVLGITEEIAGLSDIVATHNRLWPRLHAMLDEFGVKFVPPSIAVERGTAPIEFTASLLVPEELHHDGGGAETFELPGLARAATTVLRGEPDFDGGFAALRAWIERAGEREAGELREIYLDCDGPRDTWVVELQLSVEARA
jgi:hypothetical protein